MPVRRYTLSLQGPPSARQLNQQFINRHELLHGIRSAVYQHRNGRVFLTGPAGIGKTWLARYFVDEHENGRYTEDRFPRIVPVPQGFPIDSEALSRSWSRHEMVFCDDIEFSESKIDELRGFFKRNPETRALLVGRQAPPSTIDTIPEATIITVGPLSQREFSEFVTRVAPDLSDIVIETLYRNLGGVPGATYLALRALETYGVVDERLAELVRPFTSSGLLGPDGQPLSEDRAECKTIITDVSEVSDYILEKLARNPDDLYSLTPRFYEKVIAEVFRRKGYDVTLTAFSKDGGRDICAARKDSLGSFLFLIECKKYRKDRPVGVGLVRSLNGVLDSNRATAGILATTSYFTKGAKEFQKTLEFRISLQDFFGVHRWLREVTSKTLSASN
jgi:restriction system protein